MVIAVSKPLPMVLVPLVPFFFYKCASVDLTLQAANINIKRKFLKYSNDGECCSEGKIDHFLCFLKKQQHFGIEKRTD
jgi:hypothetical protein